MDYLLDVQDIHTFIGQYHILQGVDVRVPKGSITALLGRNGAGKTTTLKSILGLTPPRQGTVLFDGRELRGLRSFDIAALGIGFVSEHRAIFRDLTVDENLKIAERRKGDYARKQAFIFSLFPDLQRLITLSGANLSGGQQQMLAIARALMSSPRLLLIDEPSVGLSPLLVSQTIAKIGELKQRVGLTVLMAEQNFNQAIRIADRGYIIVHGEIAVAARSVDELQANDIVKRLYLGGVA